MNEYVPEWRKKLMKSLKKNFDEEPALEYVNLATVKGYGKPANRIVRFQSFFNQSPSKKDSKFPSLLTMYTDTRTKGVKDIIEGSKYGEMFIFYPATYEVYRLSGVLYLITSPKDPLYSNTLSSIKMFEELGYDMEKIRLQKWEEYISPIKNIVKNNLKKEMEKKKKEEANKNNIKMDKTKDNELKDKQKPIKKFNEVVNELQKNPRNEKENSFINNNKNASPDNKENNKEEKLNYINNEYVNIEEKLKDPKYEFIKIPGNILYEQMKNSFCMVFLDVELADYTNLHYAPFKRIRYHRQSSILDSYSTCDTSCQSMYICYNNKTNNIQHYMNNGPYCSTCNPLMAQSNEIIEDKKIKTKKNNIEVWKKEILYPMDHE